MRLLPTNLDRMRLGLTLLLGVLLLGFSLSTAWQTLAEERAKGSLEDNRTKAELERLVALWDRLVTNSVLSWLAELPEQKRPAQREAQLREQAPWFDGWLLWETKGTEAQILWPTAIPRQDTQRLLADACAAEGSRLQAIGKASEAAGVYRSCTSTEAEVRVFASLQGARIFQAMNQLDEAMMVLDDPQVPLRAELSDLAAKGVDLERLIARRTLAMEILTAQGQQTRAAELGTQLYRELLRLPAPWFDSAEGLAERLLHRDLPAAGVQLGEQGELDLAEARRRAKASKIVRERLIANPLIAKDSGLQVADDFWNQPGFVLVWLQVAEGRSAGIIVNTEALLNSLLSTIDGGSRKNYQLIDTNDVATSKDGATVVPLGALLGHLHLLSLPNERPKSGIGIRSIFLALLPVGVSLLLGATAFSVQVAAERRAKELRERQDAFIARVTHELKTPLAGIRVMAEGLEMGAVEDRATRERFLAKILTECDNLGARIDEVLAAARRPEIRALTAVTADALARNLFTTWAPRFQGAGAELVDKVRPTGLIQIDEVLIRDALVNLLDNALKYRKPGIRGRCEVHTYQQGRWVFFEVVDNGIGVPPNARKKVFERFTRVEGPGRGKSGGHGLGLAFVAEAAEAHGGSVECLDGLEGGARFRLRLPAA